MSRGGRRPFLRAFALASAKLKRSAGREEIRARKKRSPVTKEKSANSRFFLPLLHTGNSAPESRVKSARQRDKQGYWVRCVLKQLRRTLFFLEFFHEIWIRYSCPYLWRRGFNFYTGTTLVVGPNEEYSPAARISLWTFNNILIQNSSIRTVARDLYFWGTSSFVLLF